MPMAHWKRNLLRRAARGIGLHRTVPGPEKRIVVFHTGRCGSTILGNLLNFHPQVWWDKEILTGRAITTPDGAFAWLDERMRRGRGWHYGCEIKLGQPRDLGMAYADFIARMEAVGFRHFVYLRRLNYLRVAVSARVLRQHGIRHLRVGEQASLNPVRIEVTPRDHGRALGLVDRLADRERALVSFEAEFGERPFLSLTYESDIRDDPRVAYHKVCDFVGLPAPAVPVDLIRTNPFPLRDAIENYDEVAAALAGTPYAWMLDD